MARVRPVSFSREDQGPTVAVAEPRTDSRTEIINQIINRHKSPPTRSRVLFFQDLARFLCPVSGAVCVAYPQNLEIRQRFATPGLGVRRRTPDPCPNEMCRWPVSVAGDKGDHRGRLSPRNFLCYLHVGILFSDISHSKGRCKRKTNVISCLHYTNIFLRLSIFNNNFNVHYALCGRDR